MPTALRPSGKPSQVVPRCGTDLHGSTFGEDEGVWLKTADDRPRGKADAVHVLRTGERSRHHGSRSVRIWSDGYIIRPNRNVYGCPNRRAVCLVENAYFRTNAGGRDLACDEVRFSDKLGNEPRCRSPEQIFRSANLLDAASVLHRHSISYGEGFLLIVCDQNR